MNILLREGVPCGYQRGSVRDAIRDEVGEGMLTRRRERSKHPQRWEEDRRKVENECKGRRKISVDWRR